jgi:hypothetical protein
MAAIAAGALLASGLPAAAVTRLPVSTTGNASAKALAALSGWIVVIGTSRPRRAARPSMKPASPTR